MKMKRAQPSSFANLIAVDTLSGIELILKAVAIQYDKSLTLVGYIQMPIYVAIRGSFCLLAASQSELL